ncbi:MAG: response regulator transcription factor [Ardenticatenaceae bacterium]|nr:response regulator transcription factor [Ardenticatenaceae bacterium]
MLQRMESLRLLIVADDPLARAGLSMLLDQNPDCVVIDQIGSGEITAVSLNTPAPDVIIWDVGWEAAAILPDWAEIDLPVIALLADSEDVPTVWACGVQGLLSRDIDSRRLVLAAQAAAQKLVVVEPSFTGAFAMDTGEGRETAVSPADLTPREAEVLQLLAEGLTNKAIAQQLDISDHTVKFHVNAIMSKLGAQSRTEAVVRATRLGLILL